MWDMNEYFPIEKIDILGHSYKIICDPSSKACEENLAPSAEDPKGLKGVIIYQELTIYLDPGLSVSEKIQVLIHELLHGISYHLTNSYLFGESEREEENFINLLSGTLSQTVLSTLREWSYGNQRTRKRAKTATSSI